METMGTLNDKIYDIIVKIIPVVASLAWKDVLDAAIQKYYPLKHDKILTKIIYATIITIVLFLVLRFVESKRHVFKSKEEHKNLAEEKL